MNNIPDEILKKYAEMASEAFMEDPVYKYVTKKEKTRKKVIYHRILSRLYISRETDLFYFDEEDRGLLVLRHVNDEYKPEMFMKVPNYKEMFFVIPHLIKFSGVTGHFDNKKYMDENTYIVSPIFVAKEHQGKGVGLKLLERAKKDMAEKGFKLGLDTQNPDNVAFYEKAGFKVLKHEFYDKEQVDNYYMVWENNNL